MWSEKDKALLAGGFAILSVELAIISIRLGSILNLLQSMFE